MDYEDANQVLNNVKFGIFEPTYKVTQALIITGDIDTSVDIQNEPTNVYNERINPPFIVGPRFD
jgi:hypothetical protein